MLDYLFKFKIHQYLQGLGLLILAIGLPFNKVLMSIGTIWLISNVLLKGEFSYYWVRLRDNRIFWFIFLILLLHIIGLIYTDNFAYAFHDFNSKLPLFVIPISIIAYPLKQRFLPIILLGFIASLVITSSINYSFILSNSDEDYRNFSLFGSHIRYAILIVMGIAASIYLFIKFPKKAWLFLPFIMWLGFYTVISQTSTGFFALILLVLGILIFLFIQIRNIKIKVIFLIFCSSAISIFGYISYQIITPSKEDVFNGLDFQNLPIRSENGEIYYHDTLSQWYENGHLILSLIAEDELEEAWEKRSSIPFNFIFADGYPLKDILIRYMASKGLTKDKEGMALMTEADIQNVEMEKSSIGKTYGYVDRQIYNLKNTLFNYYMNGDPNGSSFLQRLEHLRAGIGIIKENWIFGVGTGDVQAEFNKAYKNMQTKLSEGYWNRCHNQFLTFWITFGIIGFLVFTLFWIYFLSANIRSHNFLGIVFTLVAVGSFLTEDTIETQQGVTFVAFFLAIVPLCNHFSKSTKLLKIIKKSN